MKFAVLTANGIEHRYVVNAINQVLNENLVSIVIEENIEYTLPQQFSRLFKKYSIAVMLERVTTKFIYKIIRIGNRKNNALKAVLGQQPVLNKSNFKEKVYVTNSINGDDCYAFLKKINPDYIFIYGTGIISDRILNLSRSKSFNLHTGISPYYRGSSTAFWPLYYGEASMVGATVHICTADIDGGEIASRACAKLDPNDDVHVAFARAVQVGSEIYSSIALKLVKNEVVMLKQQDFSIGTEYKFSDRTFVKELLMELRYRTGALSKAIIESNKKPLPYNDS